MQEVGGTLSMGSGRDNEALVVVQCFEPATDVRGVVGSDFRGQTDVCRKERNAKFGDQLLARISSVAELLPSEFRSRRPGCLVQWTHSCARVA